MTSINEQPIPAARPVIGEAEIEAAVRVLRSGMVVQGPEVAAFEAGVRRRSVGGRHCVAVNSGTSALQLALLALGHRPGRRGDRPVVLVRRHGQRGRAWSAPTPVFADIEPDSFCLDPDAVAAADHAAHRRDHAGAPLRPPGRDGPDHARSPQRHGLAVVEDAARRTRAALDGTPGRRVRRGRLLQLLPDQEHALPRGRHGHHRRRRARPDAAAAAQPGHGAAVRQRDRRRQHADDRRRRRDRPGAAAAAAGWTEQRRANADVPRRAALHRRSTVPPVADGARHVYHQYTVRVPRRPGRRRRRRSTERGRRQRASTTRRRSTG